MVHGRQAQAVALARGLARVKGLEQMDHVRVGKTAALVEAADADIAAGSEIRMQGQVFGRGHVIVGPDQNRAALGHGIAGVEDQVHEDLEELDRVALFHLPGATQIALDVHARRQKRPQGSERLDKKLIDINGLTETLLVVAKKHQALGQLARAGDRHLDFAQLAVTRTVAVLLGQEQFHVRADDLGAVVEIVGHARGQVGDGLHLLGIGQLLLGLFEDQLGLFLGRDVERAGLAARTASSRLALSTSAVVAAMRNCTGKGPRRWVSRTL